MDAEVSSEAPRLDAPWRAPLPTGQPLAAAAGVAGRTGFAAAQKLVAA